MKIDNAIASLAVKDLKAAAAWYEKLFGRPADSTPMPEVAEWKFKRGGWLQVYQLPERAGNGSCTLAVSDIEEVVAHLQSLDRHERTACEPESEDRDDYRPGRQSPRLCRSDRPRNGALALVWLQPQEIGREHGRSESCSLSVEG